MHHDTQQRGVKDTASKPFAEWQSDKYSSVMLNVSMLNVAMLSNVILNVVAPRRDPNRQSTLNGHVL